MSKQKKRLDSMTIAELHHQAMDAFDDATDFAKLHEVPAARAEFRRAYEFESEAARRLAPDLDLEPTRSVIHRSAATMAFRCGEYREAERLISIALSGYPHEEIAEELRDLLEEINFERHLKVKGLTLAKNEFQISLTDKAVGLGVAESDQFVVRVQTTEKMVIRLLERRKKRAFRETGKPTIDLTDMCQLYISVPRPGSFAMTVRVGIPDDQLFLAGMEDAAPLDADAMIEEMIQCFEAFEREDDLRLEELIPEVAYRNNFIALARQLAPDGDKIKSVGLTTGSGDQTRAVSIRRLRSSVATFKKAEDGQEELIEATSILKFANSTTKNNLIRVVTSEGYKQTFYVPEGMMSDIVRPLLEINVHVSGVRKGVKRVELRTIDPVVVDRQTEARPRAPEADTTG